MPWYRVHGRMVHLKIGAKAKPRQCRAPDPDGPGGLCFGMSGFLCDWPVGDEGHTCDMPLCEPHAHQVGPDKHFCPKHKLMHEEISA